MRCTCQIEYDTEIGLKNGVRKKNEIFFRDKSITKCWFESIREGGLNQHFIWTGSSERVYPPLLYSSPSPPSLRKLSGLRNFRFGLNRPLRGPFEIAPGARNDESHLNFSQTYSFSTKGSGMSLKKHLARAASY